MLSDGDRPSRFSIFNLKFKIKYKDGYGNVHQIFMYHNMYWYKLSKKNTRRTQH